MYKTLTLEKNCTPEEAASLFHENWALNKVVLLKGLDFQEADSMRDFYDKFMESAGTPGDVGEDATADSRDSAGQATGQRWTEIRYDPSFPDAYRHSANPQPLHTDGSYVPDFPDAAIIYCQAAAQNGGETVFLDSADLLEIMEDEAPDLLVRLQTENLPHARSGLKKDVKVLDTDSQGVSLSWNYYCVSSELSEDGVKLKEEFHEYVNSSERIQNSLVAVPLRPGECVMWKDYRVLHGRNGFDPDRPSERFLWKSAFFAD